MGSSVLIRLNLAPVGDLVLPLAQHGVLRGDDHVGHAEEGVGTGGVNGDFVAGVGVEGQLCAGGAADPVLLLDLDALDVIQIVQIVDQALSVLGDAQHPLALFLADDLTAAVLAHALHHFFVGQNALAAGAPVDGHGGLIGKPLLEHLEEYPLGPLVVFGVGGIHAAVPVETVAQHFQLIGEVGNILFGNYRGVNMVLYGVVLRGQTKSVKADGEKDIVALHPLFAGHDVHCGEGSGVSHMQTLAGGIRELYQAIELGLAAAGLSRVGLALFPFLLPLFLYGRKIIFHGDQLSFVIFVSLFRMPL